MPSHPVEHAALAVLEVGRGIPLLLVHGFPLDRTMWEKQVARLAGTCRLVVPDLRGFGSTPLAPTHDEADRFASSGISMQAYADDLAAMLDALNIREPVVLAGFSMGGYIAWQFHQKYAARIRALVLCDTRAVADNDQARAARLEMADNVVAQGSAGVAEAMIPKLFAEETIKRQPELVETIRGVIASTDPRSIAAALRGMAARPDVSNRLPQIDVPTLVIVGEHDAISRVEEMRGMAEAIPRAELAIIPQAGHMAPLENPQDVHVALEQFLARIARE